MVNVLDVKGNSFNLSVNDIKSYEAENVAEGLLYIVELKDGKVVELLEDEQNDEARKFLFNLD